MSYSKRLLTQKNLYNLILILILVALLGIGYLSYKEPEEQNSSGEINGIWVNDNSIVAYKIPYIPKIQVLGSFWEELNKYDWNTIEIMEKVIHCESGGRHEGVWGDNGKAYGIAQFWEDTFYWFADMAGLENPDWYNKEQQIYLLGWALENPPLQNHWTCYRNL